MKLLLVSLLWMLGLFHGAAVAQRQNFDQLHHALSIAVGDFTDRLSKEKGDPKSELWRFLHNIDNYSIGMSQSHDYFIVVFIPRQLSTPIRGGGGEYRIRKGDLGIESFNGYE